METSFEVKFLLDLFYLKGAKTTKNIFSMKSASKQLIVALLCFFVLASCKKNETVIQNRTTNGPPRADAGPDQTHYFPVDFVTLDGSLSSDPDSNIISYRWTTISGPSSPGMALSNEQTKKQVRGLLEGVYQFQLEIQDAGGLYSRDSVQVTVFPGTDTVTVVSGNATLTHVGSLSEAKSVEPATAANKLVFAGGSRHDNSPTASVDIYNLSANTWSMAKLSEARSGITTATVGTTILYAGGHHRNFSSRVDIYDAAGNTWTTAELGIPRINMTTAVSGNKVFFVGGAFTNWVDVYDDAAKTWSATHLSEARTGMCAIAAGNKVFFAGGYKKYGGLDDIPLEFSTKIDIYNTVTNSWSTAELEEARAGIAVGTAGNKVFFAGGWSYLPSGAYVESKLIDVYDIVAETWTKTELSDTRTITAVAMVGNKILFAGDEKSGTVDIYDASLNRWSTTRLNQPRSISSTATVGHKVLFFTGYPNYNRIDIYDASSNTWTTSELNKSLSFICNYCRQ